MVPARGAEGIRQDSMVPARGAEGIRRTLWCQHEVLRV